MWNPDVRWAWCTTVLVATCGCGRTTIEDCGPGGAIRFERPDKSVSCGIDGASGLLAIETPEQWQAHCKKPEPTIDLSRKTLVGYFLEDDCSYSGCASVVPLITAITKSGCTLAISTRDVDRGELGECDACVQPHDFVLLERQDAMGVIEVEP